jgi:hypothetical protein
MADGIIHPVTSQTRTTGVGIASRYIRCAWFFQLGINKKSVAAPIKHIGITGGRIAGSRTRRINNNRDFPAVNGQSLRD